MLSEICDAGIGLCFKVFEKTEGLRVLFPILAFVKFSSDNELSVKSSTNIPDLNLLFPAESSIISDFTPSSSKLREVTFSKFY